MVVMDKMFLGILEETNQHACKKRGLYTIYLIVQILKSIYTFSAKQCCCSLISKLQILTKATYKLQTNKN